MELSTGGSTDSAVDQCAQRSMELSDNSLERWCDGSLTGGTSSKHPLEDSSNISDVSLLFYCGVN
jgi:hypothetical protein